MAKYNSGLKYNFNPNEGGGMYNSAKYVFLVRVFDTIYASDNVLSPNVQNVIDIGLRISDQIAQLNNEVKQIEAFKIDDGTNKIESLIKLAEKMKLKDAQTVLANISQFEFAKVTDREPRKAIGDFIIGYGDNLDKAYQWLLPLEMIIDMGESTFPIMPATETTYIDIPYTDGEIWENTVYKNRPMSLVALSKQGLTREEKENLKREISKLLDSTKDKPHKLIRQQTSTVFEVKYSGQADTILEAQSWIKALLPFDVQPYGSPMFDQIVYGSGLLRNNGDKEATIINKITGECTNPSFQIGTITYLWKGTIGKGSTLVIDHNNLTCYLENSNGSVTNAITKLEGEFQSIPKGETLQINVSPNTENYIQTYVKEYLLW